MFSSFRLAMTWLHTWFGLVLGFVLFVVFFFGSLSVFDREIDRWAIPETRFEPQVMPSFDSVLEPIFERIEPEAEELEAARGRVGGPLEPQLPLMNWSAYTTHRVPVLTMYAEYAVKNNPNDPTDHVHGHVTIDPRNGRVLSSDQLALGSDFFYPMHYSLHLHWKDLGYWIVGVAALVMLVALLSGVVIHRKLFRELFTFRPDKSSQRSILDLHNLTGVTALPFHVMFPLTGLIIFAGIYFPVSETVLQPLAERHAQIEAQAKGLALEPAGVKAGLASVDAMVAEAKRRWAKRGIPGEVGYLSINHVGDENGYVSVYRAGSDRVTLVGQGVHFAAPTGRVIYEEPPSSAVLAINDFLTGLHLQHFEHWLLRWLYVFGGLSGSACIGTGLVFFVNKRRLKHALQGVRGARWVDAFAVTSIVGTLLATLTMLIANRVLPNELPDRGNWQERAFWAAWALSWLHGVVRTAPVLQGRIAPAWREQCCAVAALALAAVLLNWGTTGDHLVRTISRTYWPVAGVDLALLGASSVALFAAHRLKLKEASESTSDLDESPLDASSLDAASSTEVARG
jgi:uncharacterized iron-regulated membrane protein